ncbi:MAG: radical SAM protein, partial [Candidatus Thorarchaeota archaeon]
DGRCSANCAFCPQARESNSASDRLSRISWPVYDLDDVMKRLSEQMPFKRACVQVLNSPGIIEDVEQIVIQIRTRTQIPISISIHPLSTDEMMKLHLAGASSIGIALDACTEPLFNRVKGRDRGSPYRWHNHIEALTTALEVFGEGNVATHLIVGLGESEEEIIRFLKEMKRLKIRVGLFAFTNIRGTTLEDWNQPDVSIYRRVQVVHYLLNNGLLSDGQIRVAQTGEIRLDLSPNRLKEILSSGAAFQTSGCKDCNRPYYNERPSGPLYNYPRPLTQEEVKEAIAATGLVS